MTRMFYLRTTWDQPGQQPTEVQADENQSIREVVGPYIPRDVQEWVVTDKNGQDVTDLTVNDVVDKSVLFVAPAVPGG